MSSFHGKRKMEEIVPNSFQAITKVQGDSLKAHDSTKFISSYHKSARRFLEGT